MRTNAMQKLAPGLRGIGDWIGLMVFTLGAGASARRMAEAGSLASALLVAPIVIHQLTLAVIFMLRRPQSGKTDRLGLALGLLAPLMLSLAQFPARETVTTIWPLVIILCGHALALWSLAALNLSFGVAPADRELVTAGPYRFARHPIYLGEIVMAVGGLLAAPTKDGAMMVIALIIIQVLRILREERVIAGYSAYVKDVRWRLLPGVW